MLMPIMFYNCSLQQRSKTKSIMLTKSKITVARMHDPRNYAAIIGESLLSIYMKILNKKYRQIWSKGTLHTNKINN